MHGHELLDNRLRLRLTNPEELELQAYVAVCQGVTSNKLKRGLVPGPLDVKGYQRGVEGSVWVSKPEV